MKRLDSILGCEKQNVIIYNTVPGDLGSPENGSIGSFLGRDVTRSLSTYQLPGFGQQEFSAEFFFKNPQTLNTSQQDPPPSFRNGISFELTTASQEVPQGRPLDTGTQKPSAKL